MVFMPNDDAAEAESKAIFEEVAAKEGCKVLGWRKVPVRHEVVGKFAKATQPRIWQVMVEGKPGMVGEDLDREMFILRKLVERVKEARMKPSFASDFYICTLGNKTIVYKVSAQQHVFARVRPARASYATRTCLVCA
jgi:glutamate synthase (ferredoxin)